MFKKTIVAHLTRLTLLLAILALNGEAHAQVALNLIPGWNLLCNSSAEAIDVATTFGDPAKITTVWKWNNNGMKWAFYSTSMTPAALTTYSQDKGYDILTSIDSREGFWVNASMGGSLPGPAANGVMLTENDLQLGWNMEGSADNKTPSQLNQDLASSLNAAGKSIISAWAWDAPQNKWKFFSPAMEAQGGSVLANYINSKGYLPFTTPLSATDGCWLNIGPASASGQITIVMETAYDYDPQAFSFTFGNNGGTFILDDDGDNTNTYPNHTTLAGLAVGPWTFTEKTENDWALDGISCSPAAGTTVDLINHSVTVDLTGGANVTCTITNINQLPKYTGKLCGVKFNDLNGNGVQDPPTELGLQNWQISLGINKISDVITDANGNYCFNKLPAATYTVSEIPQAPWQQTYPSFPGTHTVTLKQGEQVAGLNFGNKLPADCCLDALCNGDFEHETVVTAGSYDVVDQSLIPCWHTTETNGSMEVWGSNYGGVAAYSGNQFVELNSNTGTTMYQNITVIPGSTALISWAHRGRPGFPNQMTVSIDHAVPDSVLPIPLGTFVANPTLGWIPESVAYTLPNDGITAYVLSFTSDDMGDGGNFLDAIKVCQTDTVTGPTTTTKPGPTSTTTSTTSTTTSTSSTTTTKPDPTSTTTTSTTSTTTSTSSTTTTSTTTTTQAPPTGTITIIKNADPDDTQDFFFLFGNSGGSFALHDSGDTLNHTTLAGLAVGPWSFTENEVNGWTLDSISCTPAAGTTVYLPASTVIVDLTAGANVTCTFTNIKTSATTSTTSSTTTTSTTTTTQAPSPDTGTICGIKFNDLDGDGLQDAGELGLPNWQISLGVAAVPAVMTDANGSYCFNDVPTGTYTIAETAQTPWQQTYPSAPGSHTVTLSGGQQITDLNFGNTLSACSYTPLCNGDFEDEQVVAAGNYIFKDENAISCWDTTEADGFIEFRGSGSGGIPAYSGNQFVELNAKMGATLYQNITAVPGSTITVFYAHRGRPGFPNQMTVSIDTPTPGTSAIPLGTFTADPTLGWILESVSYTFPNNGVNAYVLSFTSDDTSAGGNFLDAITVCPTDPGTTTTTSTSSTTTSTSTTSTTTSTSTTTTTQAPPTGTSTITIMKDAVPNDPQEFIFTATSTGTDLGLTSFSLADGPGTIPNSMTFANLGPGSYTFTEPPVNGWATTGNGYLGTINCTSSGTGAGTETPSFFPTNSITVDLAAGANLNLTCTFINTKQADPTTTTTSTTSTTTSTSTTTTTQAPPTGTITIIKNADPDDTQEFFFLFGDSGGSFVLHDSGDTLNHTTLAGLAVGPWSFTENEVNGWTLDSISCTPAAGTTVYLPASTVIVDLTAGANVTCTFTNIKTSATTSTTSSTTTTSTTTTTQAPSPDTGTICGIKFNDLDGDGLQDQGELGLPNWQISLGVAAIPAVMTDANGSYCFNDVPAGTYTIAETAQTPWQQTYPPAPGSHTVTLSGGQQITDLNFGNTLSACSYTPLCNGDFEDEQIVAAGNYIFKDENAISCWDTTEADGFIEFRGSGSGGIPAYSGNQFVELNAKMGATLYQNITVAPGSTITVFYAHRGRPGFPNQMTVSIDTPTPGTSAIPLGTFTADPTLGWILESVTYTFPNNGVNAYVLSFTSDDTSAGGNFLDAITVCPTDPGTTTTTTSTTSTTTSTSTTSTSTTTTQAPPTGTLTIVKDAQPDDPQAFHFATVGAGLSDFDLDDNPSDNALPNSITFTNLAAGIPFTVTEAAVDDWTVPSLQCIVAIPGLTTTFTDQLNRTFTVNLEPGANVTCTFINVKTTTTTSTTSTSTTSSTTSTTTTSTTLPPCSSPSVAQGGLCWMPVGAEMIQWSQADTFCSTSTINGQTGWRLPTVAELQSLYSSTLMNGQGWTLDYTWASDAYFNDHYMINLATGVSFHSYSYATVYSCVR